MTLLPCPACRRHVRADATTCPFCFAGRLTRAAVLAGALAGAGAATVACGGTQAKDTRSRT